MTPTKNGMFLVGVGVAILVSASYRLNFHLLRAVTDLGLRSPLGREPMPEDAANSLNANHERRLSVTCRHIDRLLSEMEGALNASASRLAFPQYVSTSHRQSDEGSRTSSLRIAGTWRPLKPADGKNPWLHEAGAR